MAILSVKSGTNWITLPDPHSMKINIADIDAATTTRNVKGVMMRDRIRGAESAVRKLECTWNGMSTTKVSDMLKTIKDKFFTMRYYDPYTDSRREGTFYIGDRSMDVYWCNDDGSSQLLNNISINFIER